MRRKSGLCYKCHKNPRRENQGYCLQCHAKVMREWRPKHKDLPPVARMKANARAYIKVYERRGKIKKLPCQICGDPKIERHHVDYNKPLEVIYLCRKHHLEVHGHQLRYA